jgi:hypothetical protein
MRHHGGVKNLVLAQRTSETCLTEHDIDGRFGPRPSRPALHRRRSSGRFQRGENREDNCHPGITFHRCTVRLRSSRPHFVVSAKKVREGLALLY